jgi:hypothetical protein
MAARQFEQVRSGREFVQTLQNHLLPLPRAAHGTRTCCG